ncbi:hypothetical protein B0H12DRAFT_1131436, partial [Mycena haematopus]
VYFSSDNALALVLDLHNYVVMNSRFPGDLKDMWITMFQKRGVQTNLKNWRGLFLSNFLANSPISWLTTELTTYSSRMVAVQQGVQTRDLMSFLAGVQTWSERHKETVYALKRDQMKGFDYLAPEGFYDAVVAYGLPPSIIDLDRAAQAETKCRIRTYYGPTSPIIVSGVTKQGGPASPLKAIYTTSLGHRYLDDVASQDVDGLVITTSNALNADPHRRDDLLQVLVTMVEATDDSFIFAKSLRAVQKFCLHMERFQFAYGWLTQWRKTFAYVLNDKDPNPPAQLTFPSVTIDPGVDPWLIKNYEVPVIRSGLDFLNAKVDSPGTRYSELKDIIEAFAFPRLTGRLPITLLRKMVAQNIVSRCRALLSLQPIKQADAEALGIQISSKIHRILGMPFSPNSKILTLPVSHHGLGFPSIARINAGISVDGLMRDLNHHITAYRHMARITLAEWTCNISGWRSDNADGNTLRTIRSKGIRKLADLGLWRNDANGKLSFDVDWMARRTGHWSPAQKINWGKIADTLQSMHASWLFDGPEDLLASRLDRRVWAEKRIHELVTCCALRPSAAASCAQVWGTDGSMIPASAALSQERQVTAAATGPATVIVKLLGRNLSILHGELMGHILALVLCDDTTAVPCLYSDHQNSVNLIDDIRSDPSQISRLRGMNGRSYYRWILELVQEGRVSMTYTRGHSTELTLPAQMNREADHYASGSQKFRYLMHVAPLPTFTMDTYTLYTPVDGWIESNAQNFVDFFLAEAAARKLAHGNRLRMLTWAHDHQSPPEYPYTRAVSAHSAVIQLYARSGQLPTAETLESRAKLDVCMCRLGCMAVESMHHIFVDCAHFSAWRNDAAEEVATRTERKLVEAGIVIDHVQRPILIAAKSLFIDDAVVWPLKISQYYLGQIPSIEAYITRGLFPDAAKRRKLMSHLSSDWHTSSIRLAGRIFGSIQRTMAARATSA